MSMLVMSHSSSEFVSPSFQEGMAAVELPQRNSPPASKSREERSERVRVRAEMCAGRGAE